MADIVKFTGSSEVAGTTSALNTLKEALADQYAATVAEDGQADFLPAAWKPPATITEDMIGAARLDLERVERALAPASQDSITRWLIQLGMATASREKSGQELKAQATLYANMLDDLPTCAFTNGSLRRALDKFQWFPTVKELRDFARGDAERMATRQNRLSALIQAGPREGAPEFTWSKEAAATQAERNRKAQEAEQEELKRILQANGAWSDAPGTVKKVGTEMNDHRVPVANPYRAAYAALRGSDDA